MNKPTSLPLLDDGGGIVVIPVVNGVAAVVDDVLLSDLPEPDPLPHSQSLGLGIDVVDTDPPGIYVAPVVS